MFQQSNTLAGDLWGGLASMLVALPSAIAFGVATFTPLGREFVGIGAMAGVLGTVALGLIAPALGGAPRLITAPCAPAAAVLSALMGELIAGKTGTPVTPEHAMMLLTIVAILSALFQVAFGSLGGGKVIKFIPFPVVSGYLSGVGTLIFLSQLPKMLGLPKGTALWQGLFDLNLWQIPGVAVGIVTIVGMVMAPRITKKLPAPIIGLISGMGTYFIVGLWHPNMYQLTNNPLLIGHIELDINAVLGGLTQRGTAISHLRYADVKAMFMPAATLSVLLSIDTLKTGVVIDALTRSRHNSNRELIGQGAANFAAAILGGMPGAGTMGATLISINSGGCTRLAGILEGIFALIALVAFGKLIGWVPISALAGILIVVAFRMFDWHSFSLLKHRSTVFDFSVIATVVIVAVRFNLIAAAGAGVAMAVILFLREQIRSSVVRRKILGSQISSKKVRLEEEKEILTTEGVKTTICELQGNLFFGTNDQLLTNLETDVLQCRFLILDMHRIQSVDFTAVHTFELIEARLRDRGAYLIFSGLPTYLPTGRDLHTYFENLGLSAHGESGFVKKCVSLDESLEWVEDKILEAHQDECQIKEECLLELHEISLLKGFKDEPEILDLLKSSIEERSHAAGTLIFRRLEEGDEIMLIRRGTVRIALPLEVGGYFTLAIFGKGNYFGDMAFIDRKEPRSTDAIADTPVDLYVISRNRFDELAKEHPKIAQRVFARLAKTLALRLRYTNAELRAVQSA